MPPRAPTFLTPDRAGDETQRRVTGANRGNRARSDIGQFMAPDEPDKTGPRERCIKPHTEPGRGHVCEHNADQIAALQSVWRDDEQAIIQAPSDHQYAKCETDRHREA